MYEIRDTKKLTSSFDSARGRAIVRHGSEIGVVVAPLRKGNAGRTGIVSRVSVRVEYNGSSRRGVTKPGAAFEADDKLENRPS